MLQDLDSSNGTAIDDVALGAYESAPLTPDSAVRLGTINFTVA